MLQNAYAAQPFPAWDLANLGLWTAAGAAFAVWRFPLVQLLATLSYAGCRPDAEAGGRMNR